MFIDKKGIIKMINEFSEVIQRFVVREIQAVLDKYKKVNKSEVEKVERLIRKISNQKLKDELLKDWNTVLELANEVEEKNIDDTIISMYQLIKSNVKSSINLNEVIDWCDEIERYAYMLIYENHLIYKKTANLDDFAKENLENMLDMDYYVDKLLSKDDVIDELISGVDIEELLDMNPTLILEDRYGEEYMYSEVEV
ncbi:MAG: hypothetical protein ACRC57_06605 [Sarcina sp.]